MAHHRESFIVFIDCGDDPALMHGGYGPLLIPADTVVPSPMIALGGGELVSVPDWQTLINGTTERLDLTVSGVSEETLRLAIIDAESVRYAPVYAGTVRYNDDWSVASIEWENVFEARSLSISRPQESDGQVTRSITLTIVQGDSIRARAGNAFFTDADQKRKYPTDAIFSNVGGITAGTSRRFGPRD
jgi:hypothetical protein